MNRTGRIVATAAIVVSCTLGVVGAASAADNESTPCDPSAYGTSGPNNDHSDDGCDTRNYLNEGKNGDSSPDSLNYGHPHGRDDTPLQNVLDSL